MADTYDVDLVVIGSGGAAMAAGIAARRADAQVVLIERATIGGTCVNVGCVPSKTLLAGAGVRHALLHNPFAGVPTSAGSADFGAMVSQKEDLTAWLRQHKYTDVADAWHFPVRKGEARFVDERTVEVNGDLLRSRAYIIATGSEPVTSGIEGIDGVHFLTSTTAMELADVPESLVIIGGSYVGMEQAQLFAHLGARVTLIGKLAPKAEPELRQVMRDAFTHDGITVIEERGLKVSNDSRQVTVTTESGGQAVGQQLLVATGRRSDTSALNLAAAGVETDHNGFISIDQHQRTTNPRIFAAGDVAGTPQFVYVAAASGRAAATNALARQGNPSSVDYTGLPAVTFTRPQLASAGLTEEQALERGYQCDCRTLSLGDVPRALVNHDTRGAVKLVSDATTGKVVGVHAAADGAGEMMLAATYAIRAGMTIEDVADTWAPYLTMAESLRLTAGLFRGNLPTSCCA